MLGKGLSGWNAGQNSVSDFPQTNTRRTLQNPFRALLLPPEKSEENVRGWLRHLTDVAKPGPSPTSRHFNNDLFKFHLLTSFASNETTDFT